MNQNAFRLYLPLVARLLVTAAAGLSPIAAVVASHQPVTVEILAAGFGTGAAAWKKWHPSASLSALWGPEADAIVTPSVENGPDGVGS